MLTSAAPGINKTINFQGKMTDDQGLNVADGTYQFVFSLYTVGSGGSATWTETVNLDVVDGIFQHNLGSSTSLPGSVDFNTDNIFLGITFNSDPDGEMTPRIQLSASPYAFNSDQLDGLDASDFVQLSPSLAQTGSIDITGSVTAAGGATVSGGAISLNDSSNFVTNINTGISTGAVNIGNASAGVLTFQSGAGIYLNNSIDGDTNINTGTSTGDINIGNPAAGAVAVQSGTGLYFNYSVNASSYINGGTSTGGVTIGNPSAGAVAVETASGIFLNNSVNGATNINTGTSTGAVNIGNTAAGAVSVASSGNITFTGNGGSSGLTVGSVLVSTLSTFRFQNGGQVTTPNSGSSFSQSISLTTGSAAGSVGSGTITIQTGNASGTSINSGGVTIDSGTATGTTGTISIGATNSSSIILGRTGVTTLNNGSLTIAQNLTVDTNTLYVDATNNRVGIGTATPSSTTVFNVYGTVPDVSTGSGMLINSVMGSNTFSQTGIRYTPSASPSSASAVDYTGALFGPTANNANLSGASLIGASAQPYVDGTTNLTLVEGFRARVYNDGTGTIGGAVGMRIQNPFNDGTITNNYGIIINTQTAGTNDYGLYIQGADTYALWVDAGTSRFDGDVVLNAALPTGDNNTQVCRASTGILSTCTGGGGGGDILNGGNTGAITIGTNNATSLTLETNNQSAVTIASGGAVQFKNATNSTTALQVTNVANNDVFWVDTTGTYGRVHAANLTLSGSSATSVSFTTPQGSSVITKFLIPLHDPGGGGQHVAMGLPAGAVTNSRAISLFDNRSAGNNQPVLSILSPNESNIFGLNTDGSNTVGWLKGVGMNVGMRVGTTDFLQTVSSTGNLQVGTSDTTAQQLILDTRTSSGDPTGVNGGMYYNSNANAFRFYQNGAWVSLGTGDILNNGQNGAITIGSNDGNSLILETNNTARLTIASGGAATFASTVTVSGNGAASTPAQYLSGTWFTGGTATTTKPQLLIQPSAATSTNWSTSGTGLGVNSASGFTGRLVDAQVNGSRRFGVSYDGTLQLGNSDNTQVATIQGVGAFGSNYLSFSAGGVNDVVAEFRDCCNYIFQVKGTGVPSFFNYGLEINGSVYVANIQPYGGGNITLGTSDTTGTQFVLDTKTGAGDPTGVNGGMYYNSNANVFRFYQNGAWVSLGSGDILNGGNTGAITIGTNDANTLTLETNNQPALTIASGGAVTLQNATDSNSAFRVTNAAGNWDGIRIDTTNNLVGIGMSSWALPLDPTGAGTTIWGHAGDSQEVATALLGRVNGRSTGHQKGIYLESYRDEVLSASGWHYTGTQFRNWGHDLTATTSGAYFFGTDMEHSLQGASGQATHATNMRLRGSYGAQIGSVYGLNAYNEINGTVTDNRSINVGGTYGSGTVTNNYGIYLENQTMGTNDYGIYIQGADTYALWADSGITRLDGDLIVDTDTLYIDATNNQVGIGTATPSSGTVLDIVGAAPDVASGRVATITSVLGSSTNYQSGLYTLSAVAPSSASSALYMGSNNAITSSSANVNAALLAGVYGQVTYTGTGTLGYAEGLRAYVANTGSGTISSAAGLTVYPTTAGTGTVTNNYGISVGNQTAGTNNYGVWIQGASTYALFVDSGTSRFDGTIQLDNGQRTRYLSNDGTTNYWNIDNSGAGTFRIFREDYGTGANGAVRFQITNAGVITLGGNTTLSGTLTAASLGTGTGTVLCRTAGNAVVVSATSACTNPSSITYKENVAALNDSLSIISQLQAVSFDWKADSGYTNQAGGSHDYGFIAQQVDTVLPEIVARDDSGNVTGINYISVIPFLAGGIQQLNVRTQSTDVRLSVAEANISSLSAAVGDFASSSSVQSLYTALAGRVDVLEQGMFVSLTVSGSASIGGDLTVTGVINAQTINLAGKLVTSGAQPTGTVLGTSTVHKTVTVTGNDTAGEVSLAFDPSATVATGQQLSVQFTAPFSAKPRVNLTPISEDAADIRYYVEPTPAGFTIYFTSLPATGKTYNFNYFVVQ